MSCCTGSSVSSWQFFCWLRRPDVSKTFRRVWTHSKVVITYVTSIYGWQIHWWK